MHRRDESQIVAVDLQEMAPIEGVTLVQVCSSAAAAYSLCVCHRVVCVTAPSVAPRLILLWETQGDITSPAVAEKIVNLFGGKKAGLSARVSVTWSDQT